MENPEMYLTEMWAKLVTMPDGVRNPKWCDMCEKIKQAEEQATTLRATLEELKEMMYYEDVTLCVEDEDGEVDEIDTDWIGEMIVQVSEIEEVLWIDFFEDKPLHLSSEDISAILDLYPDRIEE